MISDVWYITFQHVGVLHMQTSDIQCVSIVFTSSHVNSWRAHKVLLFVRPGLNRTFSVFLRHTGSYWEKKGVKRAVWQILMGNEG